MIRVALAYILDAEGRVLVARRNLAKTFGGLWEFPGGKLEDGESAAEAIVRELREELDVETEVMRMFAPYAFEGHGIQIEFIPVHCRILSGTAKDVEHEEIKFLEIDSLAGLEFAPPDYEAVEILRAAFSELLAASTSRR